jgi:hypothetical protein
LYATCKSPRVGALTLNVKRVRLDQGLAWS